MVGGTGEDNGVSVIKYVISIYENVIMKPITIVINVLIKTFKEMVTSMARDIGSQRGWVFLFLC